MSAAHHSYDYDPTWTMCSFPYMSEAFEPIRTKYGYPFKTGIQDWSQIPLQLPVNLLEEYMPIVDKVKEWLRKEFIDVCHLLTSTRTLTLQPYSTAVGLDSFFHRELAFDEMPGGRGADFDNYNNPRSVMARTSTTLNKAYQECSRLRRVKAEEAKQEAARIELARKEAVEARALRDAAEQKMKITLGDALYSLVKYERSNPKRGLPKGEQWNIIYMLRRSGDYVNMVKQILNMCLRDAITGKSLNDYDTNYLEFHLDRIDERYKGSDDVWNKHDRKLYDNIETELYIRESELV